MGQKLSSNRRYIVKENYQCHDTGMEIKKGHALVMTKKQFKQERKRARKKDGEKGKTHGSTRPIFFLQSSRIRVHLLSYESKTTDKREQYDWRPEKIWTGSTILHYPFRFFLQSSCIRVNLLSHNSKSTCMREQRD